MANRVIDADGHICEPTAVWNDYIEKKHRGDAIRVERDADGRDWISINGRIRRNLRPAAACVPWGMDDPNKVPTWDDILPGSYDGGARATVLEEEGIERSLLYPSLYLIAGRHRGSRRRRRLLPRLQRMDRRHVPRRPRQARGGRHRAAAERRGRPRGRSSTSRSSA